MAVVGLAFIIARLSGSDRDRLSSIIFAEDSGARGWSRTVTRRSIRIFTIENFYEYIAYIL